MPEFRGKCAYCGMGLEGSSHVEGMSRTFCNPNHAREFRENLIYSWFERSS